MRELLHARCTGHHAVMRSAASRSLALHWEPPVACAADSDSGAV